LTAFAYAWRTARHAAPPEVRSAVEFRQALSGWEFSRGRRGGAADRRHPRRKGLIPPMSW
jgi:hypothetical protein